MRIKTSQPDLSELVVPSGIGQQEDPDVLGPRFHFRSGNVDRNAGNPVSRISLVLPSAKPPSDIRSKIEKNEEPITKPNERPIVIDQITVEKEHLMSSLRHDPLLVLPEPTPVQSPTKPDEVDVTEQTKTHLCKKEMESIDSPMDDNANQPPPTSDQHLLVLQEPASTQDPANVYDSMQVIGKITSDLVDKYVAVEQKVMQGDDSMLPPEGEQLITLSKLPPQWNPCSGYDSMEVTGKISSKQFPTGENTSDSQSDLRESQADAAAHLTGQEKGKKPEHLAQAKTTSELKASRPECVKIVENITQVSKEAECVSSFDPSTNLALPSRDPIRENMDSEFVNSNTVLQEPGKCISKLDNGDPLQEQISTNEKNSFSAPAFEVVMPDIPVERNPVQESGMHVTNQVEDDLRIDTKREHHALLINNYKYSNDAESEELESMNGIKALKDILTSSGWMVKEAKDTTDEEFRDIVDDFVNDSSPIIFLLYYEGPCVQIKDDIYLGEDENAEFMKLQWILGKLSETVIGPRLILLNGTGPNEEEFDWKQIEQSTNNKSSLQEVLLSIPRIALTRHQTLDYSLRLAEEIVRRSHQTEECQILKDSVSTLASEFDHQMLCDSLFYT